MSYANVLNIEFDEETYALRLVVTRDAFASFVIRRTISRDEWNMQTLLRNRTVKRLTLEAFAIAVHHAHIMMVEPDWARWLVADCQRPLWNYRPCEVLELMPYRDRIGFDWDYYCGHMHANGILIIRMATGSRVPGVARYYLRTCDPGEGLNSIHVDEDVPLFMRVLIARATDPTADQRTISALCDALQQLLTLAMMYVRQNAYAQYRAVLRYFVEEKLTELH
ncbi:MAG: hypothetical protein A2848_01115 [Candidatus Magasanikbacteria bacterium RIFCSPHIGHO2_01_FULL_50_8]|uniref:Uncharacterized protein n=2 Tax=Candidatus Magasanikiibacteriota TaxID=1752731 RepID=A0A1F6LQU3_9BACT|nr:MAG: hypothetical protein A2848_01115 [Candidatus Magasanikbacteria bacterium RIFCSPHIGHO2_01_FULL_50_8]OGH67457.1 MAG: hypothetical protein A3C15_04180 [Candidatus Magasanikbacteria bacterium RIFCSPHIGHO2_02_FULL_50_9b]